MDFANLSQICGHDRVIRAKFTRPIIRIPKSSFDLVLTDWCPSGDDFVAPGPQRKEGRGCGARSKFARFFFARPLLLLVAVALVGKLTICSKGAGAAGLNI